jgi:hypothetical protein
MYRHRPYPIFPLFFIGLLSLPLMGCEEETRDNLKENSQELVVESKESLENAKEKTAEGLEIAKEKGKAGYEIAKEKGKEGLEVAKEKGKAGYEIAKEKGKEAIDALRPEKDDDKPEEEKEGHLGSETLQGLKDHAQSASDHVAHWVARGKQITHATVEVGKVLVRAVDLDVDIEPIYQDAGDEKAQADLDSAIKSMLTLEIIEGVTVGFERIKTLEKMKYKTGSGYLVLWRRGDKLIGFVWKSKRDVDLALLLGEAPRLMGLIHTAIDGKTE